METVSGLDEEKANQLLSVYPRFKLRRILGSGAFGTVAEAYDGHKQRNAALKFVAGGPRMRNVQREVLNHRALHHPHIIEYKKVFAVDGYLVIVMEYANGGDLYDFVVKRGRLTENDARTMYQQLIIAVDYCHRRHVSSRDIKCENLLLQYNGGRSRCPLLKLCDFGYSCRRVVQSDPKSMVGSLDYMPPEVILNHEKKNYVAEKYDIWSCGVVLYVMLIGIYPFSPTNISPQDERYQHVLRHNIRSLKYQLPPYLSSGATDLIRRSLCSAENRISINEILQHPWFLQRLPPDALKMNSRLLEDNASMMNQVEHRQSEKKVTEIINALRLGQAPITEELNDDYIDGLFDHEINIVGGN